MNKNKLVNIFQIAIVDVLLLMGALLNNYILHIMGLIMLFFFVAVNSVKNALLITIAFTPNLAIVVLNNEGMSFCGFLYMIILIKIILKDIGKIRIDKTLFVFFIPLFLMGLVRVFVSDSVYDLFIFLEIFLIIVLYSKILDKCSVGYLKCMYDFFVIGTIVMTLNIIVQGLVTEYVDGRIYGVLDNANYTGMIYAILFICCLVNFLYRINKVNNVIISTIAFLGVLLTGSRGAIVAIIIAFVWIVFYGTKAKRIHQLLLLFIVACLIVIFLYFAGVEMIVEIYNNTVLRTIELIQGTTEGAFLDISSGRFYLWEYYWNYVIESKNILWLGQGMSNYHLKENGGCGMMAHNAYLSSIVGNGLIGTFCILGGYIRFLFKELKLDKIRRTFLVIPITLAIGYIFLDGILDLRVPLYFVLMKILYEINESELMLRGDSNEKNNLCM